MKAIAKTTRNGGLSDSSLSINGLETWLWDAACSIRGAVDAPKFKDYILPLIFVKRLSDVFEDEIGRLAAKFGDRDTALELVEQDHSLVRFYVPAAASWSEVRRLTANVGQRLTEMVRTITKSNPSLEGVIDLVDFNATVSGQRIVEDERLKTLIEILSRRRLGLADVEPDILGRAYEYLLRKFAEGQGQSAGEFFTPREVGWLIAKLLRPAQGQSVYDPACGSAGLLIKAQLVARESNPDAKRKLRLFGQERIHTTFAIARMNMIIHDMEGEVAIGDTLRNPKFVDHGKLKTFDLVAANPMWNQDGYGEEFYESDTYERFHFGYAPVSTADWGWVQHMHGCLGNAGRAVIVLDTGSVSRGSGERGKDRERDIRKMFVDEDLIEAVVQLPDNLFYNTPAPGILLCLNKSKRKELTRRIVLVNASAEFDKGRPKNFIPETSITRIVEAVAEGRDIENFARVISAAEAGENDYNLLPARYVRPRSSDESVALADAVKQVRTAETELRLADEDLRRALTKLGLDYPDA